MIYIHSNEKMFNIPPTRTSVLIIVGQKCTLAASHVASHVEYVPRALLRWEKDGQTDGRTDAR